MKTAAEIREGIGHFTGSETFTRHGMFGNAVIMTEGVVWLRDAADCYWLIDAIGSHVVTTPRLKQEGFQAWTLTKNGGDQALPNQPHTLVCTDGDKGGGAIELARQEIVYTDFPLDKIELWLVTAPEHGAGAFVLMLPGEY